MTKCPLCGKKPVTVNKRKLLRGHYNIVNRYRKYPNLQWARVYPVRSKRGKITGYTLRASNGASGKRVKICTSCIKRMSFAKA